MLYTKKRRNSSNQDGWSSLRLGGHKTWLVLFCASPNFTICLRPLLNSFGKYTSHTHIHTLHHGAYVIFFEAKKKILFLSQSFGKKNKWNYEISKHRKQKNFNPNNSEPNTELPKMSYFLLPHPVIFWPHSALSAACRNICEGIFVCMYVCVCLHGYEHK